MTSAIAYTVTDAAAAAGVSVDTIRRAIRTDGRDAFPPPLKAKRLGAPTDKSAKYLVLREELERWAASLPDA